MSVKGKERARPGTPPRVETGSVSVKPPEGTGSVSATAPPSKPLPQLPVSSQSSFVQASTSQASNSPSTPPTGSTEKAPKGSTRPVLKRQNARTNLHAQSPPSSQGVGSSSSPSQQAQSSLLSGPQPRQTISVGGGTGVGAVNQLPLPGQPQSPKYSELNRAYPNGAPSVKFGEYEMSQLRPQPRPDGRKVDMHDWAIFLKDGVNVSKESPWKAHLSIHPNDLGKAWDIVYPELVKADHAHFKVARQDAIAAKAGYMAEWGKLPQDDRQRQMMGMTPQNIQQGMADIDRTSKGMQITLYIPPGGEKGTNQLLGDLEKKLKSAGVRPGTVHEKDRQIGNYASVRYDSDARGNYLSWDKTPSYNPAGAKDPFKNVGGYKASGR